FYRLRSRHAGQRPDLGVRELAEGESLRQARQCAERTSDADFLPRCAHVEPHPPAQPVGAGSKAVVPALAASNSRMRSRSRATAASRCAESFAISGPRRSISAVEPARARASLVRMSIGV